MGFQQDVQKRTLDSKPNGLAELGDIIVKAATDHQAHPREQQRERVANLLHALSFAASEHDAKEIRKAYYERTAISLPNAETLRSTSSSIKADNLGICVRPHLLSARIYVDQTEGNTYRVLRGVHPSTGAAREPSV